MKFLRSALVLLVFLFGKQSIASITCDFTQQFPSVSCSPYAVLATATETTSAPVTQRQWFLTGPQSYTTNIGFNPNFSFIASQPGNYCLRLWAKNSNGDTCSITKCNIVVSANPTINFTFSPALLEGCQPFTIQTNCNATPGSGTITSVQIDWGAGTAYSNTTCPSGPITKTYTGATPGCVDVTAIVTNSLGCSSDTTYDCLVRIVPKPIVNFTADTTTANCASGPLSVLFTADTVLGSALMIYEWHIDGILTPNPNGNSRFFPYTFPVNNSSCYDVKLVVRHPSGCYDSLVRNDYICVRTTPQLSFTQNISTGCANSLEPVNLVLTNTTSGLPSVTWALSGGYPIQNGPSASYIISNTGTYTVTVTGSFGSGCSSSISQQVLTVSNKPTAQFTVDDSFSCALPFTANFTANPCVGCSYLWVFQSGTPATSTQANPSITWNLLTQPDVTLYVTNSTGCVDTAFKVNYINLQRINPKIALNRSKGCSPVCVTFDDVTNYSVIPEPFGSACWSFSGPAPVPGGCQDTVKRCFTTPGCYDIKLRVTTTTGCADSVQLLDTVCVGTPPVCSLIASPTTMCYEADTVAFTLTCDSFDYARVIWGDGDPDLITFSPTFEHIYQDTGLLTTMVITYRDSCIGDTLLRQIRINPPITIFKDSTTCLTGDTVFLINQSKGATSFLWTFCNGTTSTAVNPYVRLPYCDTCTIKLETFNSQTGCTHHKDVLINTACDTASFTPTSAAICTPANVLFTNTSQSITTTKWDWDCSNGISWVGTGITGTSISHSFSSPGDYCIAMRNITTSGCIDTVYANVKACKVVADFSTNNVCFPQPYCFTDISVDSFCGTSIWQWDFGDNSGIDTTQNPCHVFPAPGIYSVKLFAQNAFGCKDSITQSVIVSNPVSLNYAVDTIICPGTLDCVTNNSTGLNLAYQWTIPTAVYSPGSSSTSAAPCFTSNTNGDYKAYLSVTSNNICNVLDSFNLHVGAPLAVGYADRDTILCPNPPQLITCVCTSPYIDSLYCWDFGDGATACSINFDSVVHLYKYPGEYPITVTVITKDGCSSTAIIDTIVVLGPFGSFSFSPTPGICACQDSVDFVVNTYNCSSLTLVYGCNQGFVQLNPIIPIGTELNPTASYFTVPYCVADSCRPQVIFGDNAGCNVLLEDQYLYVDSPVVNFTFDNYGVCVNGTVCFHDATSYALLPYQSYTIKREWDFGDGSSIDTTENPCHYYANPGGYQTILRIWSNLGCVDSITSIVVVVPEFPIAGYFADDSLVCANSPICFHDTSEIYYLTGPDYWVWDFGDGNIDTTHSPDICHSFSAGGYYRVTMCVYDSVGCPDCDSSSVIHVISTPIADAGGDQVICYGYQTQLNGSGSTSCIWSPPGLVSNPNICNPTLTLFNDTNLVLIVTDNYGCSDTDTVALSIARVFADFTVGNNFCNDDSVCVTDISTTYNGSLTAWSYDYGNGSTLTGQNVCNLYPLSGAYDIIQTVTDNHGCFDTAVHTITVLSSPIASFSLNDTIICANQSLCITDLSSSTGGIPITNWSWSYGANQGGFTGQNVPCHVYTAPFNASYNVSLALTDQNGCHDTASTIVTVNELPVANFSWTTSCEDEVMPLSSSSTPGDGVINNCEWVFWLGAPAPLIDNNCNTSYDFPPGYHDVQLVVSDANGCVDTIVKTVFTDSLSRLQIYPGDTTICVGSSIDYTVSGVFDNITWTPSTWISNPTSPVVTISPLASITYVVSAVNGVCNSDNDTFTITTIQQIPLEVDATPDRIVLGLSSNLTSQFPGNIDSIIWTPEATLDCRDCPNPIATPTQTTTYTATIYYSRNGITCSTPASATIDVLNNCDNSIIYVPNTFTPNGDGLNDVFMIRGLAATRIKHFRVFDRWGALVFEADNGEPNEPKWGWDGTDRTGKKLNPAVFVYTYEIECINKQTVSGQGNITLVR